jgi:hypothetical protein
MVRGPLVRNRRHNVRSSAGLRTGRPRTTETHNGAEKRTATSQAVAVIGALADFRPGLQASCIGEAPLALGSVHVAEFWPWYADLRSAIRSMAHMAALDFVTSAHRRNRRWPRHGTRTSGPQSGAGLTYWCRIADGTSAYQGKAVALT